MTVLRAIDTAGGFTDFANRKTIELRRANGQKFKVNWYNAIKDARLDLEVFPNDQIIVHKRIL
jgi:protein involved in polysaccharide export with SLBB domain